MDSLILSAREKKSQKSTFLDENAFGMILKSSA